MSKDLPPSRTADQYVVRFPDGMRDRIAEVAKKNSRSMNAEIIARLKYTLAVDEANTDQGFENASLKFIDQFSPETRVQIAAMIEEALKPVAAQIAVALKKPTK